LNESPYNGAGHSRLEKLLLQTSRLLNSTVEYEDLIRIALQLVCQAANSEAAFIFRIDKHIVHRRVRLWVHGDDDVRLLRKEHGTGVAGWALDHGTPLVLNDPHGDPRFSTEIADQLDFEIRNLIVLPLISRGKSLGALEVINKRGGEFEELDRDTLVGLSDQIAISIDNSQLLREARRRVQEMEKLFEVGAKLSGTLDLENALKLILDSTRELVGFDAGGIFLIDMEKNEFGDVYHQGYDSQKEKDLHLKLDSGLIGWVARTGEAAIVTDVTTDERYVAARPETRSEIVAPVAVDDQLVGVFNLESDMEGAYDGHSEDVLRAFGAQAATVIERTRLHNKIVSAQALEKQLEIAHQIQTEFLPDEDPLIEGYDVSGINIPSGEVGGDYYGFIEIGNGQMGLAIADVSGKGVPAALIMASFRASLIAEIRNHFALSSICRKVNKLLHDSVEPGDYVTGVYGALNSLDHVITYSNAGHNPPIALRSDDSVTLLDKGGPPFGIIRTAEFEERSVSLASGDIVFFYTDGVTEAENKAGDHYGEERLLELLKQTRQESARRICEVVRDAVYRFTHGETLLDDITMLVVKRR
jgi:phosphoserine phosphatase RsbU/P